MVTTILNISHKFQNMLPMPCSLWPLFSLHWLLFEYRVFRLVWLIRTPLNYSFFCFYGNVSFIRYELFSNDNIRSNKRKNRQTIFSVKCYPQPNFVNLQIRHSCSTSGAKLLSSNVLKFWPYVVVYKAVSSVCFRY